MCVSLLGAGQFFALFVICSHTSFVFTPGPPTAETGTVAGAEESTVDIAASGAVVGLTTVSLGQGQGPVAEELINKVRREKRGWFHPLVCVCVVGAIFEVGMKRTLNLLVECTCESGY